MQEGGVVGKCTRLTIRVFFVVQHPPLPSSLHLHTSSPRNSAANPRDRWEGWGGGVSE